MYLLERSAAEFPLHAGTEEDGQARAVEHRQLERLRAVQLQAYRAAVQPKRGQLIIDDGPHLRAGRRADEGLRQQLAALHAEPARQRMVARRHDEELLVPHRLAVQIPWKRSRGHEAEVQLAA